MLTAFAVLTDGLVYAAYLFLVAVGLSLIFGVMKILNVTHGSFYAFGAYGAAIAAGAYFNQDYPAAGGLLLMCVVAIVLAFVASYALRHTRYGRLLTVVIFDRELAAAFGINVQVMYTVTFVLGAILGALGGAVMAPKIAVKLGIGVEVIVLAFAVVIICGLGSIEGALIGALIVG